MAFGQALAQVGAGLARHPAEAFRAGARYATGLVEAGAAVAVRALGGEAPGPTAPAPKDRRFTDPTWQENPAYFGLLQAYLLSARLSRELVEAADLEEPAAGKAQFAAELYLDALAPSNYLLGNPAAIKKAFETGGMSLVRGFRNFLEDLAENGGMPRQVELSAFAVGENLAATPGKVVFRNELMELIQYTPQTESVYEVPLLCSPPWINKYYIMDLAPGRSFIEWAVAHGHTVFAISYRNPDESLRDVSLDEYLTRGPEAALSVVEEITGAPQANVAGLCIGGTLTAMLLAQFAGAGDERVRSATLLNTLVDFSEPGPLGAFADAKTVAGLARKMERRGYLDGAEIARTFNVLRANDLIWSYVGSNWLMGEHPPAFDILAWNADSTRLPAALHSFYLRSCYVDNEFARGELELDGTRLDPAAITPDLYVLAAKEDHIAPWRSSFKAVRLFSGSDVRFVLTSSGHIAGIVNPPSDKSSHWTGDEPTTDPEEWFASATRHQGSWWEDWATWAAARAGDRRKPPRTGSKTHPMLGDAPGTYVHGK
ncbi:MAG: alpha/beta fold hydrolase [Actinobacteria bacterium]|nr:alpha/beta fold hydrolase [Actinomycetota bacterium]